MGGFTPAKARIKLGKVHILWPHFKPDATADPKACTLDLFNLSMIKRIKLPTHMSMAKNGPRQKGDVLCPLLCNSILDNGGARKEDRAKGEDLIGQRPKAFNNHD